MAKKDRNSLKKRVAAFLAILIALTMILSMAAPFLSALVYANSETTTEQDEEPAEFGTNLFTIDAKVGFDNTYMLEHTTPFTFIVTNNGSEFKGEIQLKVYLYEGSEVYTRKYAVYYLPIELAPNATKEVTMDVNLSALRNYFTVSMEDARGNMVYQQNFPAIARSPESVWTAVLSDNPSELVYLNQTGQTTAVAEQSYGATLYETFFLTEKTFPETVEVLQNFRMLIINDFNTDTLSKEQTEAIKQWVEAGGMLVLGTGVNAHKVLGNLDGVLDFTYTSRTDTRLNQEGQSFTVSDASIAGALTAEDSVLTEGTVYKYIGNGTVILHSYDIGKNPVPAIENMEGKLYGIYQSISPDAFYTTNNYFTSDSYNYYEARNLSENIMPVKGNDIDIIYFLIFLYILIIGPVCYIYLKKKDKREKGWVIIPVLSLIVTAVVYFMGLNSYYRGSTIHVVSSVHMNYGSPVAQADLFVGIKTNQKGNLHFKAEDDIIIDATPEYYYYYYGSRQQKDELTIKINASGAPELTYANREAWSSNTFLSEKTVDMGGMLEADLQLDGQYISGTITNNTSFDMESAVLAYGSRFFGVGDIPSGGTVTVDLDNSIVPATGKGYYNGYYYSYYSDLEEIFDIGYNRYSGFIKTNDITDYYTGYSRYRLLTGIYDRSYNYGNGAVNNNIDAVGFFAFNNKENMIEGNKYLNGKLMQEQQENIFTMSMPLKFAPGSVVEIPYGFILPSEIKGADGEIVDYYAYDNYIYAYNVYDLEATFKVPAEIEAQQVKLQWNTYYGSLLSGEIYNWETESWEDASPVSNRLSLDNTVEITDPKPYISSDGEIKFIGHFDDTDIAVPEIYLKGGVK